VSSGSLRYRILIMLLSEGFFTKNMDAEINPSKYKNRLKVPRLELCTNQKSWTM